MQEIQGNIWDQKCDWLCVTTNGIIKKNGCAVMGKGIALQAKQRYPYIDKILAQKIQKNGNIVSPLIKVDGHCILSFPTKHHWKDSSDLELIKESATQLKTHFDEQSEKPVVILPRPGCSNGKLDWADVKAIIEPILIDDNFLVISL